MVSSPPTETGVTEVDGENRVVLSLTTVGNDVVEGLNGTYTLDPATASALADRLKQAAEDATGDSDAELGGLDGVGLVVGLIDNTRPGPNGKPPRIVRATQHLTLDHLARASNRDLVERYVELGARRVVEEYRSDDEEEP